MTNAQMIACWMLIERLTSDEASSVTINNPNPDFGGPAFAISVSGGWTDYQDVRFDGDTILACLEHAYRARSMTLGPTDGSGWYDDYPTTANSELAKLFKGTE